MKIKNKKSNLIILALFILTNFLLPLNLKASTLKDIGATDLELLEEFDPEVQRLKKEIADYQAQLSELEKQRAAYENSVRAKRQEISNLKNQIDILDNTIAKTSLDIRSTELEIEKNNLEITNLELEINYKEKEIKSQQGKMGDVLRTIQEHDRQTSYLEILILKGSLGNFFKEVNQLQLLEGNLNDKLSGLAELKNQLQAKKNNLEERKNQLSQLREKLSSTGDRLESDKNVKNQLLNKTKGQEADFQQLLNEVRAEQESINSDIQSLEVQARKRLLESKGILPSNEGFIWPVSSRIISAYFHDPDYPYRYVFEHPAIDIGRTPQGTPIRAARSGYVAKVKIDSTTAYGYILIVHTDGLSTVYGHISKAYINTDSFVVQGEVIGLSGGTPGTAGSGRLTTGPHLHFEVRLNGIPVDPLKYLP